MPKYLVGSEHGRPKDIDNFVHYDTELNGANILKTSLKREQYAIYGSNKFRTSLYRPFCKKWLYHDSVLNDRPSLFAKIFPTNASELENAAIWLKVWLRMANVCL